MVDLKLASPVCMESFADCQACWRSIVNVSIFAATAASSTDPIGYKHKHVGFNIYYH
jgi:hypothetical protein